MLLSGMCNLFPYIITGQSKCGLKLQKKLFSHLFSILTNQKQEEIAHKISALNTPVGSRRESWKR